MSCPNAMCLNLVLDWILFFRAVAVAVAVARLVVRFLALGFCALAVLLKGAVSFVSFALFNNYNK